MFVVGIPHRSTGHGTCDLPSFLSLINCLTELSWEDVSRLMSLRTAGRFAWQPSKRERYTGAQQIQEASRRVPVKS